VAAVVWDLLLAGAAGGSVFLAQRFAGFDLRVRLAEAEELSQKVVLVAVVGVLAGFTGAGARAAGQRIGRRRAERGGQVEQLPITVSTIDNPKTRAKQRLGAERTEWMTTYTESHAGDVEHLGEEEILDRADLFIRTRGLANVLYYRVEGNAEPVDMHTMREALAKIMGDEKSPLVKRVRVLLVVLLDNDGKARADSLAEEGRAIAASRQQVSAPAGRRRTPRARRR
jgi:hypothetical protein